MSHLIAAVKALPSVNLGESFLVEVQTVASPNRQPVEIAINGVRGDAQFLQATGWAGQRRVVVSAWDEAGNEDTAVVNVQYVAAEQSDARPLLRCYSLRFRPYGVRLTLVQQNGAAATVKSVEWDFGDNSRTRTQRGSVSHVYSSVPASGKLYQSFHVTATVVDGTSPPLQSRCTVTVWNDYVEHKRAGILRPRTWVKRAVVIDPHTIGASYSIENLEDEEIRFDSQRIEFQYMDREAAVSFSDVQPCSVVVGPKLTVHPIFQLPRQSLPPDAFAFAVHLRGRSRSGLEAHASLHFPYRDNPGAAVAEDRPEALQVLARIERDRLLPGTDTVSAEAILELADAGVLSAKDVLALLPPPSAAAMCAAVAPATPAPPSPGAVCDPYTCSNDPQQPNLRCQLTNEETSVAHYGRLSNARKGDIVLTAAAQPGPIGTVLFHVNPPQRYAHCGLMVNDYFCIRHSTADHHYIEDLDLVPLKGLPPDAIKYGWPGTITQSIDECYLGGKVKAPKPAEKVVVKLDFFGKTIKEMTVKDTKDEYAIAPFNFEPIAQPLNPLLPVGWDNLFVIQPRVVTIDPMKERPADRANVHQVAESAKKLRGHYRFFGYSDGSVAMKGAFNAPAGMSHWPSGEGTRATNCSTFIWAAAKDAGFHLEGTGAKITAADLEESDKKLAKADVSTLDGLYFYDEKERTTAATALHEYQRLQVMAKLKEESSSFFGPIVDSLTSVCNSIANQLVNTFASDAASDTDSTAWSTPGTGHSVSPDNLMLWDAPGVRVGLYGYSVMEAKYDSAIWKKERVSRWLPAKPSALTIRGRVLYHGKPSAGAHVVISCRETFADSAGRFEFTSTSEGRYLATATTYWSMGKDAPALLLKGERPIVINSGATEFVIELMDPPDTMRDISITGWGTIVDPGVTGDHSGKFFFMKTIRLATEEAGGGTIKPVGSTSHDTADEPIGLVGDEAHCTFGFNATLQPDLSVIVHHEAKIMKHDDFGGLIGGDWAVPKDGSVSSKTPGKVFGSAELSGRNSCTFSFSITNAMHTSAG